MFNLKQKHKTMKKTYIIPRAEIIDIRPEGLLASSGLSITNESAAPDAPALVNKREDWNIWGDDNR